MRSQRITSSLRSCLRSPFSKTPSPFHSDQYEIIRSLEDSFSLLLDPKNQYTSFKMETLLDSTEITHEVRILTVPRKFLFSTGAVFEKVKSLLSGAEVVFNFDPSHCLRVDRRLYYEEQVGGEKGEMGGRREELGNVQPSPLDEGFYRNIFGLNFAEECGFNTGMVRGVIQKGLTKVGESRSGTKDDRSIIKRAQGVIWESLVTRKDFYFVNPNVKMLFEYALLQGFNTDEVFLAGMPELLFRAKFAQQVTNASVLSDLHSISGLVENQKFFLENKKSSGDGAENYTQNELLSDQDFIIKSCLHFNSLHFRARFTLLLLRELALARHNLVLVADPLTTFYLRELLRDEKKVLESRSQSQGSDQSQDSGQSPEEQWAQMVEYFESNPPIDKDQDETVKHYLDKASEPQKTLEEAPCSIPKNFSQFNQLDKISLSSPQVLDSLAFKMAVWDVIENTKAYQSEHCSHDLYFTGDRLLEGLATSDSYIRDMMKRIAEKARRSQAQEPLEQLRKEAEARLKIPFDPEEMIGAGN